jgi:hypothetical protein
VEVLNVCFRDAHLVTHPFIGPNYRVCDGLRDVAGLHTDGDGARG